MVHAINPTSPEAVSSGVGVSGEHTAGVGSSIPPSLWDAPGEKTQMGSAEGRLEDTENPTVSEKHSQGTRVAILMAAL